MYHLLGFYPYIYSYLMPKTPNLLPIYRIKVKNGKLIVEI